MIFNKENNYKINDYENVTGAIPVFSYVEIDAETVDHTKNMMMIIVDTEQK